MKIRITGTEEECRNFIEVLLNNVPRGYIRNVSGFYPNTRKCTYSNEGRVYIDVDVPLDRKKMIE